jgi:hypothetical protein
MADKGNIKYYAQELKENTYNLTRMNLVMRGILPNNIVTRNADTLEDDWPFFDDQDPSIRTTRSTSTPSSRTRPTRKSGTRSTRTATPATPASA